MLNKAHSSAVRLMAILPFFFAVINAAHAQIPVATDSKIVEVSPNPIKFIGALETEAMIDADVVIERTPCKQKYPRDAIRRGETGAVILQILVNVNGYISRTKVVASSGFASLDRAALIGFLGCKRKPVLNNGVPTETWVDMKYVWKIE